MHGNNNKPSDRTCDLKRAVLNNQTDRHLSIENKKICKKKSTEAKIFFSIARVKYRREG